MPQKEFLETGIIVGTHGTKGELRVQPWCDSPDFLTGFDRLYLEQGQSSVKVTEAKVHKRMVLMKLDGVDDIAGAEALRGKVLFIRRDSVQLPEGSHFVQDLIGCAVFDVDTGERLGELSDVSFTGANDVWHICREGKTHLIPAIADVVIEEDVENGQIKIRPLKGLFEE